MKERDINSVLFTKKDISTINKLLPLMLLVMLVPAVLIIVMELILRHYIPLFTVMMLSLFIYIMCCVPAWVAVSEGIKKIRGFSGDDCPLSMSGKAQMLHPCKISAYMYYLPSSLLTDMEYDSYLVIYN